MKSAHWRTVVAGCWVAGATCGCVTTSMPREDTEAITQQAFGCRESVHAPRPAFGVNVSVDRTPEAVQKVAPEYPTPPRETGVEGTVVVAALVCEHGRVVETRVVKSIPMLDASAVAAVSRWTYRPAIVSGRPVPFWVTEPVKYTLH